MWWLKTNNQAYILQNELYRQWCKCQNSGWISEGLETAFMCHWVPRRITRIWARFKTVEIKFLNRWRNRRLMNRWERDRMMIWTLGQMKMIRRESSSLRISKLSKMRIWKWMIKGRRKRIEAKVSNIRCRVWRISRWWGSRTNKEKIGSESNREWWARTTRTVLSKTITITNNSRQQKIRRGWFHIHTI